MDDLMLHVSIYFTAFRVYTPAVRYGQLQQQELDENDQMELCDQIEAEENYFEGSSALLEDELGDVEAASLSPRLNPMPVGKMAAIHIHAAE